MSDFTYHIDAGTYRIHVGVGAFAILNSLLAEERFISGKKFILCDENTLQHCVPAVVAGVNSLKAAEIIEVEAGEINKDLDTAKAVLSVLAEKGADRNSILVNVGGGMVTDLGGFCASVYMRGIQYINVPTTLMGMADASFGGKTAVDLEGLKNLIGTFHEPAGVFCYPGFLQTLSAEQQLSGFAEIMKHGLIADRSHWKSAIERARNGADAALIADSVKIKTTIVSSDPKESGPRKLLNFGHTAGHAIESFYLKKEKVILHGFAVAAGIITESYLSYLKENLDEGSLNEISSFIFSLYGDLLPVDFEETEVIQLMIHDKKNTNGNINFTLLNGIGKAVYDRTFETKEILKALDYLKKLSAKGYGSNASST